MNRKEILVVSFSGGKTSAFMCHYLIENWSHKYSFVFVFANTGREHEKTLEFVKKCDEFFNLNLVWIEAVINQKKGIGPRHRIVDFNTANRRGGPFEDYIKKEGVPNVSKPMCSDRLKTQAIKSYLRSVGLVKRGYKAPIAIGMRADEPKRSKLDSDAVKRHNLVYPLAHWDEQGFDKQDVNDFWEDMPFNLDIEEHLGNCINCFKKSDAKLFKVFNSKPESFDWCREMEDKYGNGYVFFRQSRSTDSLLKSFKQFKNVNNQSSGGCDDECRAFD